MIILGKVRCVLCLICTGIMKAGTDCCKQEHLEGEGEIGQLHEKEAPDELIPTI